jgi:3-methyladenine DNA glycosylase AlkC
MVRFPELINRSGNHGEPVAMAEPFKNLFRAGTVREIADALAAAGPFDHPSFYERANDGLEDLELKDRIRQVAAAVRAHLDPDWPTALAHLLRALPPPLEGTEAVTSSIAVWPLCQVVETYGLDHPDLSIPALRELTIRFSAEFAIRPYLERWPEETLAALHEWAEDPNPHVRRLVSEGTRPRLPWGSRLRRFQDDPAPTVALLDRLVDDPEAFVRRSVANPLGDIAKDHPDLAVEVAARWLRDPTPERTRLVAHALRYLVKKGHRGALALMGVGEPEVEEVRFAVTPEAVAFPGELTVEVALRSASDRKQKLVIDYVMHFVTARGKLSPKTFKWSTRTLQPRASLKLTKVHRLKPVSTRRFHSGQHKVELLVNGRVLGSMAFELDVSSPG